MSMSESANVSEEPGAPADSEGKSDDVVEDAPDDELGDDDLVDPIVDEEALIESKTEMERRFIRRHRDLFSETLGPDRHLSVEPMRILLQGLKSNDPRLYQYKPRQIPLHIRERAKALLDGLESQGIIRKVQPNKGSQFCAQAGFVPKKGGKLRFVVDFTALNRYIQRPVHSFPSSDQIAQSIKSTTTHVGVVDFPSGYFQLRLHPESQMYTVFNTEFGRYLFTRSPQGLSSSGDSFNANTDRFFSGLGDWLLKQVDDLLVQATSVSDLLSKMEIMASEGRQFGCTYSISKFTLGRDVNVVSGFQLTLDPTGKESPKLGPNPSLSLIHI